MILLHQSWAGGLSGWGYGSASTTTPPVANAFPLDKNWQVNNTKFNLDDPAFTNAYADVGTNNWTAADLAAALNASSGSAPAPYQTTVWAAGNNGTVDYVYVVSGPVPTSIDLVSIPVSIPVGTV